MAQGDGSSGGDSVLATTDLRHMKIKLRKLFGMSAGEIALSPQAQSVSLLQERSLDSVRRKIHLG